MANPQQALQRMTEEFTTLQKELSSVVEARQTLESQLQENRSVQKEFSGLDDDANIFKLIGPVLVKQDKSEAIMAVGGRLEFIEAEITRTEEKIKNIQEKQEKKKIEIMQLQNMVVQQQQQQAQVAA
ncbi:Prefoldin beta-like protein [Morchella conica CCBAS932]|uniref:Prefoldin beta-like protein n=1 Tax=Morchella conica CCBAS932 TaxID=1392247 RepID=A0A3N4KGN6_9PEZI|nr:Prefoldin beta-like protein [Morchella conica CCBAS932]